MNRFNLSGLFLLVFIIFIVFIASGCKESPDTTDVVVSDGITNNDLSTGLPEILPNASVYRVADKSNNFFAKFLLSEKIEGLGVVFCVKKFGDPKWIRLGNDILYTDKNGKATLPSIRDRLPASILNEAPIDIQLQARIYFNASTYISDNKGLIRVLSSVKNENPEVVFTDHDNTVHATGGRNSIEDWIDFLNWAKNDWPLVDNMVVDSFKELRARERDIVIVSGMFNDIRFKCREQMNIHFEENGRRFIPIIVKEDLPYQHSNEFKKEALAILQNLYGKDNCLAMVGDTVREDGYGAVSNTIRYIPFQINYRLSPDLLNTDGFGSIDPSIIAYDWAEVLEAMEHEAFTEENYFLKRYRPLLNISHRGGARLLPENTLEAYRNSYQLGAEVIEGDLHMTRDKVVVISHDASVDRCTDGTGKISDKEYSDIQQLDAGYAFTTDGGETYPYRGQGYQIPTLEEVFSDQSLNGKPMILEIKQEGRKIVEKVLDLIEAYNMEDNLILGAFNQKTVDLISELANERAMDIVRIFPTEGVLKFMVTPRNIMERDDYKSPGDVLCLPKEMMTTLIMDKARYLGYKVYVWTVNSETGMNYQLNTIKPDGIMTDAPDLLESLIN